MSSSLEFSFEPLAPMAPVAALAAPVVVDAEQAAERAREQGFAEGRAAGMAAAAADVEAALSALGIAGAALEEQRDRAAVELERDAVTLGLRIAERVLAGAIAVQPERVLDVVRGALRGVIERERVQILISDDDLELVRAASGALLAELGGIGHLEIQAERRVASGGAIIRTAEGEVDATLGAKLDAVQALLEAELEP